jgi:hypothetical protein
MTSIIGFGIAFGAAFIVCWLLVFVGYCRDYHQANKEFFSAWENDSYEVMETYEYDTLTADELRITFPSNLIHRSLITDIHGVIITGYAWSDHSIHITHEHGMYVPGFIRRQLEEYTQQIAVMHKLKSDNNCDHARQAP